MVCRLQVTTHLSGSRLDLTSMHVLVGMHDEKLITKNGLKKDVYFATQNEIHFTIVKTITSVFSK